MFCVYGMSGGTATLSYRLSREYQKKGFRVLYLCEEINDINNNHLFQEQGIEVVVCKRPKWFASIRTKVLQADEVVVWVYSYELYSVAEKIKRARKSLDTNIFLYVVHERCLIRGKGTGKGIYEMLCSRINALNALYIQTIDHNNELLFMEQRVMDLTERYLGIRFRDRKNKVLPLPYLFEHEQTDVINRKRIISTMARIDFPFKGYIMGLIDIFLQYYEEYDLELWIIGTGESENVLCDRIHQLNEGVQKRIKLFGNIEYSKVKDILKDTFVFVGMGTGLLDAASVSLPSIGVQAYKYQCLGDGFLNEKPYILGYMSEQEKLHSIEKELLGVLNMDPEKYSELCHREYTAARDYYGVDNFLHKLDKLKKGNQGHSLFEKIGYEINDILGKVNLYLHKHG